MVVDKSSIKKNIGKDVIIYSDIGEEKVYYYKGKVLAVDDFFITLFNFKENKEMQLPLSRIIRIEIVKELGDSNG